MTFIRVCDADIQKIEDYVKTELYDDLQSQYNIVDELSDDSIVALFFGPFSKDKTRFKFYFGEKKLIKELVKHTQIVVDTPNTNAGLGHFMKKITVKKNMSFSASTRCINGSFFFIDRVSLNALNSRQSMGTGIESSNARNKKIFNIDEQKNILFTKAKTVTSKFEKENKVKQVRIFEEEFVNVSGSCYDDVKAMVHCSFCYEENSIEGVRLFFNRTSNGGYWVLSNLLKHFNLHHGVNSCSEPTLIALEVEPITANNHQAKRDVQNDADVFPIADFVDQLFTQMSVQQIKMVNASLLNKEDLSYLIFKKTVPEGAVKICNIKADGDCLFAAITHQLYHVKSGTPSHEKSTNKLKVETIEYIKKNIESFENYLKGRVLAYKQISEIKNMHEEFLNFLNIRLPNRKSWGGTETMKAVSELYKVNIVVINEDGSCKMGFRHNPDYDRSIILSFRQYANSSAANSMPNHYDSIVEISDIALKHFSDQATQAEQKYKTLTNKADEIYAIEDSE